MTPPRRTFSSPNHSAPRLIARLAMALVASLLLVLDSASSTHAAEPTQPAPTTAAIPASRAATNVAIITIKGEIDGVTAHSIERRIKEALAGGADALVFDIHSPGGLVSAGLQITSLIKQAPVNTVAWINTEAYSMAAVIALACDEIVVGAHATMGDAAPIQITMNPLGGGIVPMGDTERQKMMAPLIADVVESARVNGYDENLVQAFITLGVETWMVREKATGRAFFVTEQEYRAIFGTAPPRGSPHIRSGVFDKESSAASDAVADAEASDPAPTEDPTAFRPAFEGTMDAGAQKQVNERLTDTASTRPLFTRADRDAYEFVEYATDGKTLLTIKESDLKRYGFADPNTTIRSDGDLQQYFGAAHVRRLDQTWSEDLVAFMTQGISGQVVKGLLIIVFLMAMFIEMSMPGVGLPGVIALVALAGLVVPPMLIGAANWWMGALIVGGLLLLLLEVFVLPGFGVPGIIGLVMLFAGLVGTFAAPGQLFPGVGSGGMGELARAGSIVLLSLFIAGVGLFFFVKYTHRFPVVGKLVLAHQQSASTDADAGMLAAMASEAPSKGPVARGAVGRATTPLRPSGTAEFDDRLVDVVAEFGFIDAGRRVRVTSVTEYRVAVEEIREA